MTSAEYFATLTVPALKARLADFSVTGISKFRKAELVNLLTVLMDDAHQDAAASAASKARKVIAAHMGCKARATAYKRQNGCDKLTNNQRKRLRKKARHNVKALLAA